MKFLLVSVVSSFARENYYECTTVFKGKSKKMNILVSTKLDTTLCIIGYLGVPVEGGREAGRERESLLKSASTILKKLQMYIQELTTIYWMLWIPLFLDIKTYFILGYKDGVKGQHNSETSPKLPVSEDHVAVNVENTQVSWYNSNMYRSKGLIHSIVNQIAIY